MKKQDVHQPDAVTSQTSKPIVFEASLITVLLLASAVFIALLISEVPPKIAAIALLIIVLQILAGGSFLSMFVHKSHLTWKEFCGVGLALGSLLTFGFDQIFRNTDISGFAWTLPILFLPLAISFVIH